MVFITGNIHAPVIMIAEKGADLIKALWLREEIFRRKRYNHSVRLIQNNETQSTPEI